MADEESEGGDPACWMSRVCLYCGVMVEEGPPGPRCPHCGEERP